MPNNNTDRFEELRRELARIPTAVKPSASGTAGGATNDIASPVDTASPVDAELALLRAVNDELARNGESPTSAPTPGRNGNGSSFNGRVARLLGKRDDRSESLTRELHTARKRADALTDRLDRAWANNEVARNQLEAAEARIAELEQRLAEQATLYPAGHFYAPSPSPRDRDREHEWTLRWWREDPSGIDMRRAYQVGIAHELLNAYPTTTLSAEPTEGKRYHARNGFYPFGDAFVLEQLVKREVPRRVIEIGSGFSSAVLLDTLDEIGDAPTRCTFVDPFPDRLHHLLDDSDREKHRVIERRVQELPLGEFDALEAGDILLIDSSHVSKAGSDVNFLFFNVLPRLAPGVRVHIHDVPFPFAYPREWMDEGRAWTEAYLLRAFLQFNDQFEVEFSTSYLLQHLEDEVHAGLPRVFADPGTAFWIRRRA